MKSSLDEFVSVVDRLISRLDELEGRVSALEQWAAPPRDAPIPAAAVVAAQAHPLAQITSPSRLLPALGKVSLGMAGAYVLRAVAETSVLPQWVIAALGLAYACLWLLQAARTSGRNRVIGAAYAVASAVILAPMLWELTLRFKVVSANGAAAMLAAFVALASVLGWKRNLAVVAAAPTIFAVAVAASLFVATRAPLPFTAAMLAIAMMTEIAAHAGRWSGLRVVPALFADLLLLALIVIYTGRGLPPEYQPIAPGMLLALFAALFILYSVSALVCTLALRREIGILDVCQMVAAFLLAAFGSIGIADGAAARVIGGFSLAGSAGCYLLVFTRFGNTGPARNYHVFSACAAVLLLGGSLWFFGDRAAVAVLGSAAVAATVAGLNSGRFILEVHGAIYAAAAVFVSGLPASFAKLLAGDASGQPGWPVWMAGAFAIVGYAFTWRPITPQFIGDAKHKPQLFLRLALAALALCAAMSLAMIGGLAAIGPAGPARLASLRTLVICAFALAMGWAGARFKHMELTWLAYIALAFCTLKLFWEDLRAGSPGAIAFSLSCYGICWLLASRFKKTGTTG